MDVSAFVSYRDRLVSACSKAIVGKKREITLIAVCHVCGGHVLLEDVPGTGKTMLFRAFAKACGGSFKRIQFTPDVMPGDVTGIHFYNMKTGDFEFRPGPVFADMVLADEINRATPRTQSSLLEAMAERQVSVDGETRQLSETFMVAATQNPIESYGTFPLPEAQLDRFFMKLSLGYMTPEQEKQVLRRPDTKEILAGLQPVITKEELALLRSTYREVEVSEPVADYLMSIITETRNSKRLACGVSTRGSLSLFKAAQITAAMEGRSYVIPEDVKENVVPVLAHRLTVVTGSHLSPEAYLRQVLDEIPVPLE